MPVQVTIRFKTPHTKWITDYDKEFGDDINVCVVTTKNQPILPNLGLQRDIPYSMDSRLLLNGARTEMPQSERSQAIKAMLVWLNEQERGATISALIRHVELEITSMGGSTRTIRSYVMRCRSQGLIRVDGIRLICTEKCKRWLARKIS